MMSACVHFVSPPQRALWLSSITSSFSLLRPPVCLLLREATPSFSSRMAEGSVAAASVMNAVMRDRVATATASGAHSMTLAKAVDFKEDGNAKLRAGDVAGAMKAYHYVSLRIRNKGEVRKDRDAEGKRTRLTRGKLKTKPRAQPKEKEAVVGKISGHMECVSRGGCFSCESTFSVSPQMRSWIVE